MWHGVGETSVHSHLPFYARTTKLEKRISPKTSGDFKCRIWGPSWCKYLSPTKFHDANGQSQVCLSFAPKFHLVSCCWLPPPSAMAHENGRRHNNKCGQFETYGIGTPQSLSSILMWGDWQSPLKNQLIFRAEFQNSLLKNWWLHKFFTSTWIITNQAPMRSRPLSTFFLTPWSTTMKADKKVN